MKWSPDQSLQWLLPANRATRWNDRDQVAATFDRRETQRPLSSTGPQRPERPTSGAKQPERQNWPPDRSEEHTSELQPLIRTSHAVLCLNKTTPTPRQPFRH